MAENKKTIEEYVDNLPAAQQTIVFELRRLIKAAAPEAKESIKWAQPVYEVNGPVAYIKAFASQVNFGFWRGAELTDPQHLLVGDGSRMKHIKLRTADDIRADQFVTFVQEAVQLNLLHGDPTKGSRAR